MVEEPKSYPIIWDMGKNSETDAFVKDVALDNRESLAKKEVTCAFCDKVIDWHSRPRPVIDTIGENSVIFCSGYCQWVYLGNDELR
jgi:endogenous inhibitor of DNA gyrase (YacG/DUF329 family)